MEPFHTDRVRLPTTSTALAIIEDVGPITLSAVGNISYEDGAFLLSLLESIRPRHVVEVGVASGTSTLMLLRGLERLAPGADLVSIDLRDDYYVDPSRPVGYLVHESYATPPPHWTMLTGVGTSSFAAHPRLAWQNQMRRFDFVFVDAHHGHPWATLDALCLLPYVAPGSWIVLHDINLPAIGDYPYYGPVHLLETWPGEVVVSDELPIPNIGALRLTDAGTQDADALIRALDRPWDGGIGTDDAGRLSAHLQTLLDEPRFQAVRRAFERNRDLPVR